MGKCYLHFTNIRSLLLILENHSIRFGQVSRSNDEIEKRIRLLSLKDIEQRGRVEQRGRAPAFGNRQSISLEDKTTEH